MAKLNIIGVGPGSPDYVTPIARKTVQQAQVIIGAQRSLNLFTNDIKGETMVLTAKNLNEALKHAAESVKNGKTVALLSTGDPGFSGLLHTVLKSGFAKDIEINVIPGISSLQACAAHLKLSWDDAALFTFHEGNVSAGEKEALASAVLGGKDVMLLPDSRGFAPKDIASYLISAGVNSETQSFVCENLTLENEKITSASLEQISQLSFGALSVMVIKQTSITR